MRLTLFSQSTTIEHTLADSPLTVNSAGDAEIEKTGLIDCQLGSRHYLQLDAAEALRVGEAFVRLANRIVASQKRKRRK